MVVLISKGCWTVSGNKLKVAWKMGNWKTSMMLMLVNRIAHRSGFRSTFFQLFFLDSTPSIVNVPDLLPQSTSDQDLAPSDDGNAAAWVDSDDERIVVSLTSSPRLRKLRTAESEDLVNGKEYSKRLRRQFERLHPIPGWANPSAAREVVSKKRRKLSTASGSSEANASADEISIGTDDLSTQPLAKLLQNANRLTQPTSTSSTKRKQLRPEIIDIHRTKDVGTAQPVSQLLSLISYYSC